MTDEELAGLECGVALRQTGHLPARLAARLTRRYRREVIAALYDAGLPPLRGSQFFSTQFDFVPVAMIVVRPCPLPLGRAAATTLLHPRHRWPIGKTVAWVGALVTTAVAIFSFIGVYDGELFWDHMVQHLLLIMVAAPLFAIASPLELAWRSTTGTAHLVVTEALRSPVAKFFGHPAVAFVLYAVFIPISHLTIWYNSRSCTRASTTREHLAFLLVGYLFWRQIFGNDPNCYRLHPALQFFYLFLAIPIDTFTGLSLAGATKEMFPAYLATHRAWGPSYVVDLHVGGVDHVGGGRHADAVADDPRGAPLDAHGGAQGRAHRPRARRAGTGRGPGGSAVQPPRSMSSTRTPSGSVQ